MIKILKVILVGLSMIILVLTGILIGMNLKQKKQQPVLKMTADWEKTMEAGEIAQLVEDNYWRFVKASYIMIGTPPECDYYKIVSQVPRNDYVTSNFYIDDDSDFMYYHNSNGERISKIAIDISAYQTDLNWEAIKAAGVDVAMVRLGYRGYSNGKLVQDKMFEEHVNAALEAGLQVGVYFFTQGLNAEEGEQEARFVLDAISGYDIRGPIVIDTEKLEADGARTLEMNADARTDVVVSFCDTVINAGHIAMIYSNRNWYVQSLDMTRLGAYKLWVAHYTNEPDFPYNYGGWQYTDQGNIPGLDCNVDLNVWFE